jgi:hypothetical protein
LILSVGALLAAAVVLAGCGGSGSASGGVAGARSTGSFSASVRGFEARLQTSVHAFQSGDLTKAIAPGGPMLNDCMGTLDAEVAPHVTTHAQKQALAHLRVAYGQMTQAADAGASGSMTKAKQFARAALHEARAAVGLAG